jgi:hypothetical protein
MIRTISTQTQRIGQVLNLFAVVLSVSMFARGVEVHLGFALFMAVAVPLLLRLTLGLLIHEYRYDAGAWLEEFDA